MRREVDSNFFELLTLYPPPPVPLLWGDTPTKCKGGKRELKTPPMAVTAISGLVE